MAKLQGTILASKIVPTDSLDTYATHEDKYGRGGHRSVDTLEERDNITTPRRKEGMTVYVKENKTKYILESGIDNVNWKVDSSGESSPSALTVDALKAILKGLEDGTISSKEYIVLVNKEDDKVSVLSINTLLDTLISSVGPSNGGGSSFTIEDKTKLDSIEEEATKNKTDGFLLSRSNHTGTQGIDTITNLESILVTINNKITAINSPFKGIYASLDSFKVQNTKYPVGEEPADGNVTDSLPNDNFYNMETGGLFYFTTDKIWMDGNNKLQIKFDEVNSTITTINNNLETVNEVMANGKYMGAYDNLIDIPKSIPVLDEENNPVIDVDSGLPVTQDILVNSFAIVKNSKSVAYFNGVDWVLLNSIIVDDLDTVDADKPLSANQGKVLKGLLDNIDNDVRNLIDIISSDDTTLDEIQEIVNYIKLNRSTLEALSIPSIAGLENALQLLENNKVDKIVGMSLSKNNLTDELKSSIEEIKVKEISLDIVNKKLQVKLTNSNVVNIDINPIVENNTIDNLESTDGSKPLSAKQGKILNDTKLDKTGGKLTGPIIGTKEKKVSLGASNNIDLAEGNLFIKNVTSNITFTLSNISAENDIVHTFILEIVNGGNYTITWFNNIKWDNGTAPTLSTNGTDILSFYTHDKGVTWRGFILAIDSK